MEKTLRKFTSHDDLRMENYRYWAGKSMAEKVDAIAEMSEAAYRDWYKQNNLPYPEQGSSRTLIRVQRTQR